MMDVFRTFLSEVNRSVLEGAKSFRYIAVIPATSICLFHDSARQHDSKLSRLSTTKSSLEMKIPMNSWCYVLILRRCSYRTSAECTDSYMLKYQIFTFTLLFSFYWRQYNNNKTASHAVPCSIWYQIVFKKLLRQYGS